MSTFYGLCLMAGGVPALAASCVALRLARGRAETAVAVAAWAFCMAAVVGGGLLLT